MESKLTEETRAVSVTLSSLVRIICWCRQEKFDIGFSATICKTVCTMLSDHCPVLSWTLVYCGQTTGQIKLPFCTEVGLSPGHVVLVIVRF